jgi:hypothetical protein
MAQDNPCHGNEPDPIQAVQDIRLVLGGNLEKVCRVLASTKAKKELL